ncbi:Fatty acid-binding protein [Sarcoptes scabiei]|uniref:Fatty acid-binding protein n=1 Tax=Sarcoptes scabiei TaxID=52283 RepID=A0A834R5L6_SARSC|nr:Fatty acid-binding protein [Sarcoptes scabiei]UXI20788.1 serine/threonine protein phosphatase 4 [Sarcoptes scabiei]
MATSSDNLPDYFYGKFKLESSENFDAFLQEIGVGFVTRKMANIANPDLEISKESDGKVCIKVVTSFRTNVIRFHLNEEFDEIRMDGKTVKSKVEFEPPNKFIQYQWDDKLRMKYIREFLPDRINVTSICNNVQCFRVYRRL